MQPWRAWGSRCCLLTSSMSTWPARTWRSSTWGPKPRAPRSTSPIPKTAVDLRSFGHSPNGCAALSEIRLTGTLCPRTYLNIYYPAQQTALGDAHGSDQTSVYSHCDRHRWPQWTYRIERWHGKGRPFGAKRDGR